MCYVLIGYGASLRGEEVPLTSMKGMRFFWEETRTSAEPYIMIPLFGRFKGETGYRALPSYFRPVPEWDPPQTLARQINDKKGQRSGEAKRVVLPTRQGEKG